VLATITHTSVGWQAIANSSHRICSPGFPQAAGFVDGCCKNSVDTLWQTVAQLLANDGSSRQADRLVFRQLEERMKNLHTTRRVFLGVAAAALMAAATGSASAQSNSITIWVGSWWEPQIPVAQE